MTCRFVDRLGPKQGFFIALLAKVGGGYPTTVGGLDVLKDYFADLGSGIVQRVDDRLVAMPAASDPLEEPTLEALRRLAATGRDLEGRCRVAQAALAEVFGNCGGQAERVFGRPLWKQCDWSRTLTDECGTTVTSATQLAHFLSALVGGFTVGPDGTASAFCQGLISWQKLLLDIEATVAGREVDMRGLTALVGTALLTPAEAQVTVMGMLGDTVGELEAELSGLPDAVRTQAPLRLRD